LPGLLQAAGGRFAVRDPADEASMLDSPIPLLMIIAAALTIGGSMLVLSALLGRPRESQVDTTPYESGMAPDMRMEKHRFSVKFYLVAMLFILFDIEAAFMIPWAVTFRTFAENRVFVLVEMLVFLGILIAGFAYVWSRGALEWE
jgi:NADH-quinone oxidoreductase subunit A